MEKPESSIRLQPPRLLYVLALCPVLLPLQCLSQVPGSGGNYAQPSHAPKAAGRHDGQSGKWIVDPRDPGPDVPATGRSLFDQIFARRQGGHDVPYPFPALLQRIRDELAPVDDPIRQVSVPLGRSLRRLAAAPEYFRYPRIVVSVDAEPAAVPGHAGLLLKGRLFLGYQEKSSVLEVISYNPEAGRFEFQEVKGYGPGLTPRVGYARRAVCLSCHQNAGPIFPAEPWRETDANLEIAARLREASGSTSEKRAYAPRFDDAWAIDYASDRANYFSSSQFLWREACESADAARAFESIQCRAGMLHAVLQYRLMGQFDPQAERYRNAFVPMVGRNWQSRWPRGLLIATADLPDRDPFVPVAARLEDPLAPRAPRAFWSRPDAHLLAGIVYQTAEFFAEADMERIDRALHREALKRGAYGRKYRSACEFKRVVRNDPDDIFRFSCAPAGDAHAAGFSAEGLVTMNDGHVSAGNLNRLRLASYPERRFLALGEGQIGGPGGVSVRLHATGGRLGARLLDGTLLEQLRFDWPHRRGRHPAAFAATATLETLDDVGPLDKAIERMAVATAAGETDALSSKPFRRRSILGHLYTSLGVSNLAWRNESAAERPSGGPPPATPTHTRSLAPLYRYCAQCHAGDEAYPPGFLSGTQAEVSRKLRACAPRILFRLDLWNRESGGRIVSPMPPAHWVKGQGLQEVQWRESQALNDLQLAARQLLSRTDTESNTEPTQTMNTVCAPPDFADIRLDRTPASTKP